MGMGMWRTWRTLWRRGGSVSLIVLGGVWDWGWIVGGVFLEEGKGSFKGEWTRGWANLCCWSFQL